MLFIDGIRKRSWLQMFNPLRKHKSPPNNDLTAGDGSDFESHTSSPDTAGYIGKKLIFLMTCQDLFFFFYFRLHMTYE